MFGSETTTPEAIEALKKEKANLLVAQRSLLRQWVCKAVDRLVECGEESVARLGRVESLLTS